MNQLAEELFQKHCMNADRVDYKPPKPFFYGVDWDGLLPFQRELLAEEGCCPKCSDREWVLVFNDKKGKQPKSWIMCHTCEYLAVEADHGGLPCKTLPLSATTARAGTLPELFTTLDALDVDERYLSIAQKLKRSTPTNKQPLKYSNLTHYEKRRRVEQWWDELDFADKEQIYKDFEEDEKFINESRSGRFANRAKI